MKIYTSHIKPGTVPVMVTEGFSIGAALLGWLWLLWQRAWIPAILLFAAQMLILRLAPAWAAPGLSLGLIAVQGLFGRDMVRWSLARGGFTEGPIVAAPDNDAALLRLLTDRADLLTGLDGAPA